MVEPAVAPVAARDAVQSDIAVAHHHRTRRARFAGGAHVKQRLIKPPVYGVIVAGDCDVVHARGHTSTRLAVADIEIHTLNIREMMLPKWALLEQLQTRFALAAKTK